jgi:hypothetical protein
VILLGKSAGVTSARAFTAGFREAMLAGVGLALAAALVSLVGKKRPEWKKLWEPQVFLPA